MMMLRILIVNDDERERIVLRYLLEQLMEVEIIEELVHGLEALLLCQEKRIDLLFLDIGAGDRGKMDMAIKIMELKQSPLLVLISSSADMAIEAWELGVLDYILKPLEQTRIEKTVSRGKQRLAHRTYVDQLVNDKLKQKIEFMLDRYQNQEVYSRKLPVREKGKISLLSPEEIIYCESQGKKVFLCTPSQGYMSNYTLNELETRLDTFCFFRAHQAFIVNLNYVKEIINFGEGSYLLHLEGSDKNIILSRARAKSLRIKLGIQ